MDNKSAEPVEILQLSPMIIPGWEDPVLPPGVAHGGISRSIYPDPEGLLMVIDPFMKRSPVTGAYEIAMAVDDTVTVWLNGEKTSASKTIKPGEESDRIRLYLPPGLLVNGINELFYRVTRLSGNPNDSEPILKVLYHDPAPGYPAPAGIVVNHPASVGPTEAAQGVVVSVKLTNARPYDEVTLTVGTWSRTITVAESALPITPSLTLTLTLTAADFQLIGDSHLTPIKARVVDQLSNSNVSATTFMDIHASQRLLQQAILKEVLDENNDDPNYVDLTKMNGGPLWAVVHLIREIWSVKDQIRLKFTAELEGKEVASHEETLEITQVPAQFSWRIENAMVIEDAKVKLVYEQIRGGEVIGVSSAAEAQVCGKRAPELVVDTPIKLSGPNVSIAGSGLETHWSFTGDYPVGTTEKIKVSGGIGPYTFATSNTLIASVNSEGLIESQGNGEAIITVTDSSQQTAFVEVSCENVTRVLFKNSVEEQLATVQWVRDVGGAVIPVDPNDARILLLSKKYTYVPGFVYLTGDPSLKNTCIAYWGYVTPTIPSKWWPGHVGAASRYPGLCFSS
ncbi:hypothetical protein [Pseudomonas fluorescens]|uniref:BIG2 domain-containing protein n=1 Tax=Pseudomonas fluorescens TaxID=294 RepID=A0A5E7UY03_PSEFL|nr:hypothetical protein [Pseudomonas fluorescens]VVQ14338.1 hypothetical protein PS941_04125 [Pseudomonas fluorescens]